MLPGEVLIRPATFDEVAPLFAELDVDLGERYGVGEPVQFARAEFDPPGGRLLVASSVIAGGELLGCVGLRPLPGLPGLPGIAGIAELKRMYVRPDARRLGVARALLAACEQAAAELGYQQLWLETGGRQPEAVELYRSAGYRPVDRFGQYRASPDAIYLGREVSPRWSGGVPA